MSKATERRKIVASTKSRDRGMKVDFELRKRHVKNTSIAFIVKASRASDVVRGGTVRHGGRVNNAHKSR